MPQQNVFFCRRVGVPEEFLRFEGNPLVPSPVFGPFAATYEFSREEAQRNIDLCFLSQDGEYEVVGYVMSLQELEKE